MPTIVSRGHSETKGHGSQNCAGNSATVKARFSNLRVETGRDQSKLTVARLASHMQDCGLRRPIDQWKNNFPISQLCIDVDAVRAVVWYEGTAIPGLSPESKAETPKDFYSSVHCKKPTLDGDGSVREWLREVMGGSSS